MRSLDALEGIRQSAAPASGSPNRRLQMRRSHTMEPERTHAARVSEVDETSPSNSSFNSEMPRPSVIRRISANGKTYVPKRSASPATRSVPASASASVAPSLTASPTSFAFPTANPGYPQLGSAICDLIPGSSRMERRQSDILPSTGVYSNGEMGHSDRGASMVNLSSVASSSLYRAGSSQSSAIRSGPLQILEFEESGMPAVKYVSDYSESTDSLLPINELIPPAIGQLYWSRTIWLGIPFTQHWHRPDGSHQAYPPTWHEGG